MSNTIIEVRLIEVHYVSSPPGYLLMGPTLRPAVSDRKREWPQVGRHPKYHRRGNLFGFNVLFFLLLSPPFLVENVFVWNLRNCHTAWSRTVYPRRRHLLHLATTSFRDPVSTSSTSAFRFILRLTFLNSYFSFKREVNLRMACDFSFGIASMQYSEGRRKIVSECPRIRARPTW